MLDMSNNVAAVSKMTVFLSLIAFFATSLS